eukprot:CAMPEP_0206258294 /NCGR_PEP_ID=MMETSP0047_2-20121206/25838_1 /ASSEMBLY_ACC=CAM_ASM_000192 /TAXON_ID=195065 /ORGANISM="Chroomonas mesostigmatica_cf, Strain CCMP1168" /LENGTH=142 /DNA_ID=CAMNT_0053685019 /DNA_START=15 /DNA_END=440 /DNA_ORIENTATION=-
MADGEGGGLPSQPRPKLISISPPAFDLGRIADDGCHCLRAFRIHNNTDEELDVRMSSDRGEEVNFQLENENLKDDDAIGQEGAENDYNQLFNQINHVDSVRLSPRAVQRVILVYLPSRTSAGPVEADRKAAVKVLQGEGRSN